MNIAVYIPNKGTAGLLSTLFDLYQQKRTVTFSCRFYINDFDLLCDFVPGEYDALFLSGNKSDSVIEELKPKDEQIRFIRIVSLDQNTADTGLNFWYCLPEPLDTLFLFPVLDRLMGEISRKDEAGMVIKTKGSVMRLAFSQIEYVEVIGRSILFHLCDGKQEEVPGTFSDYEARLLQWPDFIKVHRAYIVNLRHIAKLNAEGILTRSGCWVPVSKHLYPQLKKDYLGSLMLPETEGISQQDKPAPAAANCESRYVILLVDDEQQERLRWSQVLIEHGCVVHTADNAETALTLAGQARFDCVILDVNLGSVSGFDLCAKLQEITGAPIFYLSSLTDTEHQTKGFLTGGMDYITKDVTPELFWLKVQSRIKTACALRSELFSGSLCLDLKERKAFLKGRTLPLTTVEFDLLHLLMQNPGTTYTPNKLYELIWGNRQWDDGHTVQLHLSQLCRKLENVGTGHRFIETIWGEGYRFIPEA